MNKMSIRKFPTAFPDRLLIKQRYSSALNWSATGQIDNVFPFNNLNDVDATASGDQLPNLYDELSTIYNRFKVYASKIEVEVVNLSETEPVEMIIVAQNNSSATNVRTLKENPYSKTYVCGVMDGGRPVVRRSMYISAKKLAGDQLSNSTYSGTTTTDPSIKFHWIVCGSSLGAGNLDCSVRILITYYVAWYHRLQVQFSQGPALEAAPESITLPGV